ncbi:hypothetical protein [Citrifermentans bremense]|uniref:hypothetical protein n=1 Tax=Citrifermentans bremense TaxID=60035 RepID=UPI000404B9B3|nr:hypothetical protein [Citrifermentans bremense]
MTAVSPAYLHGYSFCAPAGEICAVTLEQVVPALKSLERQVASGLHAAGFVSYEAAGAFNGDLTTCAPGKLPLLWFGLYQNRSQAPFPPHESPFYCGDWRPSLDAAAFDRGGAAMPRRSF